MSPSGATVYTTDQGSGTVSVIDVSTETVTATVPVGVSRFGVSVHPSRPLVYAANFASNSVSVISTASNTVIETVPVGSGPFAFGEFITPLAASRNRLTALGSASLWLGVANSDDTGRRIDVRVEIYKNSVLIGAGELRDQRVAGNALANATAFAVPLSLVGGEVDVGSHDVLSSIVKVRRAAGAVTSAYGCGTAMACRAPIREEEGLEPFRRDARRSGDVLVLPGRALSADPMRPEPRA